MSPLINALWPVLLSLALVLGSGCSDRNEHSWFDPDTGHPNIKVWNVEHGIEWKKDKVGCAECHGDDLRGGISKVSCYIADFRGEKCHQGGPAAAGHPPPGFADPRIHGPMAKAAPGINSGFAWCQECHGYDFLGGLVRITCFACHGVRAPHPPPPWRGGEFTHTDTNEGNAPVCGQCHRKAGAGGTVGCFNGTLCHAAAGVHPAGWGQPGQHGAASKKAPGGMTGFSSCQPCHGDGFNGGSSGVSCFPCHGLDAPHPPPPWRGGALTHTNTNEANAEVCGRCHRRPGASGPAACFNGTLCHAAVGVHPPGWGQPAQHGASAKQPPGVFTGFSSCQPCHGQLFAGGTSEVSCFTCHGVNAPHAPSPWVGGAFTHTNTNGANAEVCGLCHRKPAAVGPSQCFNGTLCHSGF